VTFWHLHSTVSYLVLDLDPIPRPLRQIYSNVQSVAMTPEARSEALNSIPLKRFGQPAEIADAAIFLATNKYANNCVLNLDGGLSAI